MSIMDSPFPEPGILLGYLRVTEWGQYPGVGGTMVSAMYLPEWGLHHRNEQYLGVFERAADREVVP